MALNMGETNMREFDELWPCNNDDNKPDENTRTLITLLFEKVSKAVSFQILVNETITNKTHTTFDKSLHFAGTLLVGGGAFSYRHCATRRGGGNCLSLRS